MAKARGRSVDLFCMVMLMILIFGIVSGAQAQGNAGAVRRIIDKRVRVKVDNADIRSAFKQLFESAGVRYILTPDLKSANVTVDLNNVTFRNALASLLKASPAPVVCRLEHGVYTIRAREEQGNGDGIPMIDGLFQWRLPIKIRSDQLVSSATAIVANLHRHPEYDFLNMIYEVQPEDNSILVSWTDEQELRTFREVIRLFDVLPRQLGIRAHVVLNLHDRGTYESVFTVEGRTVSEHALRMETTTNGYTPPGKKVILSSGTFSVDVKPTLNGNETVRLDAECTLDLTYRIPGTAAPVHLHNTFNGAGRFRSGESMPLARTVLRLGGSKSSMREGELRIFLTPTILKERISNEGIGPDGSIGPGGVPFVPGNVPVGPGGVNPGGGPHP
jgi:hypothetical protein